MSKRKTARLTGDLITHSACSSAQQNAGQHANDNPARNSRRGLVLTDESARHRFRATLPPHVKADLYDIPAEGLWRLTMDDVRGFASVYVAATAGILAFIL
ncbi:MAG: hypothetical protein AAF559_01405 [Pseudomonadota bacterium]